MLGCTSYSCPGLGGKSTNVKSQETEVLSGGGLTALPHSKSLLSAGVHSWEPRGSAGRSPGREQFSVLIALQVFYNKGDEFCTSVIQDVKGHFNGNHQGVDVVIRL